MRKSNLARLACMVWLVFASSAAAQLGGTPEQQVFEPSETTDGGGNTKDATSSLSSLCGTAALLEVKNACAIAQIATIEATAERAVAEARLGIEARKDSVLLAQQKGQHLVKALDAQAWRSEIIFWMAMAIVCLGVIAAGMQFRIGWRNVGGPATEFTVNEKQLTIKTTWIGVVLLAMSMVFFALYLTLVYRLEAL